MDFELLQQARKRTRIESQPRQEAAQRHYELGCSLLATAQAEPDIELLREAADAFQMAIQEHRSWPEPYLGLVVIFGMLNRSAQASKYLQIASRLDPKHPALAKMSRALAGSFHNRAASRPHVKRIEMPDLKRMSGSSQIFNYFKNR